MTENNPTARTQILAIKHLEKTDGDRHKAEATMLAELKADKALKAFLEDYILSEFCRNAIREAAQYMNRHILRETVSQTSKPAWTVPKTAGAGITAREEIEKTIFFWQIWGGLPLGKANKSELESARRKHLARGNQDLVKAGVYLTLISGMPDEISTVEEVFKVEEVETIFRESGLESSPNINP